MSEHVFEVPITSAHTHMISDGHATGLS